MKRSRTLIAGAIITAYLCIIYAGPGSCQPPVPAAARAGVAERGMRAAPAPKEKKPPIVIIAPPEEQLKLPEGKKVLVEAFEFEGNTVVSTEELIKITDQFKHKELSLNELRDIAKAIDGLYSKKGFFLARAYLPPQEIKDNRVRIAVIEGKLGKIIVEKGKFYSERLVRNYFNVTTKGIVNYKKLIKSLLILNDFPDLNVKALMQKGETPYTTDILLQVQDKFPFHASFDYNNFGSNYVSRHRFGFNTEFNGMAIEGDKVTLREVFGSPAKSIAFEDAGYSIPVTYYGTRAGFEYIRSDFAVQREYKGLKSVGTSSIYSTSATHPLVKTLTSTSTLNGGLDIKQFANYQLSDRTSIDKDTVLKIGISGDGLDDKNGRNFYSLLGSFGLHMLGASPNESVDASRTNADSQFFKMNVDAARFQKFLFDSFVLIKGQAQFAANSLTIPEQYYIGGADSVRGYQLADFLGDYGYTGTFELRSPPPYIGNIKDPFMHKPLKDIFQLVGFFDMGQVFTKKPQANEDKKNFICGSGFGIRINYLNNYSVRLDVGFPIGGKKPSDGSTATTYVQVMAKY